MGIIHVSSLLTEATTIRKYEESVVEHVAGVDQTVL